MSLMHFKKKKGIVIYAVLKKNCIPKISIYYKLSLIS